MKIQKLQNNKLLSRVPRSLLIISLVVFSLGIVVTPLVRADQFDDQIRSLRQQNADKQAQQQVLNTEASSLEGTIAALQSQIATLQKQINDNEAKNADLQKQIEVAEQELDKQKKLLGENIKAMYLEGQISTIEILASSKDLSEYVDKEQYRDTVKSKIKKTLDKVTALKLDLKKQKEELEGLIKDQKTMQAQVAAQQAESDRLLGLNSDQRNALDTQIKDNNSKIGDLRRQQVAQNALLFGNGLRNIPDSSGYPWANAQPFPNETADPWGMFLRQCVSYTAWKVWHSGRHMPYWGGFGNANQWDDNARREGIPVDGTPRVGDVAVSNAGYYGHVMYVEAVYGDGRILVSQYNAAWTGTYSEAIIYPGALVFIHFP